MPIARLVTHKDYLLHDMGQGHPECPDRLRAISRQLEQNGLLERVQLVQPAPIDPRLLELNHPRNYVQRLEAISAQGGGMIDPDTQANAESYRVGLLAAGGVAGLSEEIFKHGGGAGFALVRPPGHHAEPGRSMGFCLFNNVAVAAEHLIKNLGARKVAIFDPDLHHGNGTQASFYDRDDVLYLSTHQYPYYPGTGHYSEVGRGRGEGYTINVPLPAGQGDGDFVHVYRELLMPIVRSYGPDFILVSSGYDTYRLDPLGGMKVTEDGFAALYRMFLDLAAEVCDGKILFALEGGYHLEGLARSVARTVEQMLGDELEYSDPAPSAATMEYVRDLKTHFSKWWEFFRK